MSDYAFLNDKLSRKTSIFGLRLWVVLGICVGAAIVLVLFLISLWFTSKRNKKRNTLTLKQSHTIPNVSKEIQEIRIDPSRHAKPDSKPQNPDPLPESDPILALHQGEERPISARNRIHIEIRNRRRIFKNFVWWRGTAIDEGGEEVKGGRGRG